MTGPHRRPRSLGEAKRLTLVLTTVLFGTALFLGGATRSAALATIIATCFAGIWLWRSLCDGWNAIATVLLGLSLWTVLSAIPLPLLFVSELSPSSGAIWSGVLEPLQGSPPSWVPLSLDSAASWLEAGKWGAYSVVAAFAGRLAALKGLKTPLIVVWGSVSAICLVALGHGIISAESVYGIYEPQMVGKGNRLGPLLNPNNLAGYANLGAVCGAAVLGNRQPGLPRSLVASGTVICVATTIMSASRAGILSLLLAIVLIASSWNRKTPGRSPSAQDFGFPIAVVFISLGGLAIGSFGLSSVLWRDLLSDDLSKLEILPKFFPAVRDYWAFGAGRGAFETLSERYISTGGAVIFRNVENFPLSWAIEWGVAASAASLLLFFWLLRPQRLGLQFSRTARVVWIGLLIVAIQNLADIGLELPSLCLALSAVLGALQQSRPARLRSQTIREQPANTWLKRILHTRPRWAGRAATYSAVGVCAASVLLTLLHGPDAVTVRQRLSLQLDSTDWNSIEAQDKFRRNIRTARLQRPAEPYIAIAGAIGSVRAGKDALPWAAAALEAAPHSARSHYVTALALKQREAVNQALLELKLTVSADAQLTHHAVDLARSWTNDSKTLRKLVPEGKKGTVTLLSLATSFPRHEAPRLRREFLNAALQRSPHDRAVNMTLGADLLVDLQRGTEPCSVYKKPSPMSEGREPLSPMECALENRTATSNRLNDCIGVLLNKHSSHCEGIRLQAQFAAHKGNKKAASNALNQECHTCIGAISCFQDALTIAQTPELAKERKLAETNYLGLACRSTRSCTRAEEQLGRQAWNRGNWIQAHGHFLKAASLSRSPKLWVMAGKAAARAGQLARAESALHQAEQLGSSDPSLSEEVKKLRKASLQQLLRK